MNAGIDLGYSAVKAVSGERRFQFPSVVGTPDKGRFAIWQQNGNIVLDVPGEGECLIGEGAIEQSRFIGRREDRNWINSDEYYRLMLAAFTELTAGTVVDLTVVTGLPIAFYSDKEDLKKRLLGEHQATRKGRRAQRFRVANARVIPQPFGALLSIALDDRGRMVDTALATGSVGIVDVGGKTTNLLSAHRLAEVGRETTSVNVGAWDMVRAIRQYLMENCPNLELRDHQIIDAIIARQVKYFGEPVDLGPAVDAALEPMADQVIAQATQLWNGGASLDAVLVVGGGALLLGSAIQAHFRHARVVEDPVFANAIGYWKFAQRVG